MSRGELAVSIEWKNVKVIKTPPTSEATLKTNYVPDPELMILPIPANSEDTASAPAT